VFAAKYDLDGKHSISIEPASQWTVLEKRMRTPIMFVGPDSKGSRFHAVLDIFPIESLPKEILLPATFDSFVKGFEKGKKDWIQENGAELVQFFPDEKISWQHAPTVYHLKFSYQLEGDTFTEHTYYFACDEIPMHAKALIPAGDSAEQAEKLILKMLSGISCSKKK
jgi:hypothetical protein